ncbi:MAG: oxidoreductase [Thermoanaerobaculia bacterium]
MELKAMVAGASGLVGGFLLEDLLAEPRYQQVLSLGRRQLGLNSPRLSERRVSFEELDSVTDLPAADHVFCCLGTTLARAGSKAAFRQVDFDFVLALGRLAVRIGARQFLVVSSMGADARSWFFYNRVKGEAEEALKALGFPGLQILRPSLLLGERQEKRPGERLAIQLSGPLGPLFLGPLRKAKPIPAATVARAMVAIALAAPAGVHVFANDRLFDLGSHG